MFNMTNLQLITNCRLITNINNLHFAMHQSIHSI